MHQTGGQDSRVRTNYYQAERVDGASLGYTRYRAGIYGCCAVEEYVLFFIFSVNQLFLQRATVRPQVPGGSSGFTTPG
jgi:hypothetical protein